MRIESPVGICHLAASERGLTHVSLDAGRVGPTREDAASRRHLEQAAAALSEYFDGARLDFDDLTLAPSGTPFQERVWRALLEIPFGATESYGAIARRIGSPGAARAVGMANHRNPLWIIQPCHRVVGANGSLTGYAGGLDCKRWLLAHEASFADPLFARQAHAGAARR